MRLLLTILLWVLLVVLGLLVLLLICPVWAHLRLDYDVLTVKVQIFGLKFTVYPLKQKQRKPKKKQTAPPPQKPQSKHTPEKKFELTFDKLVSLVGAAGKITKRILGALKVRKIKVLIPICASDAAQTALLYGKFSAWFYSGVATLRNVLDLEFEDINIIPDFGGDNKYRRSFYCKIGTCPLIMLGIAIYAFKVLKKERIL